MKQLQIKWNIKLINFYFQVEIFGFRQPNDIQI